ncbi:MAG: HNH endonuclease [Proteobacteria bacterium]|nr:HNH endonuclease [Pseudomonadota bacterium]
MEVKTKRCSRCHRYLPATPALFHRNKSYTDGLHPSCKECRSKYEHDLRIEKAAGNFAVSEDIKGEEWRAAFGHDDWYDVSNMGRIRRTAGGGGATIGRVLKQSVTNTGYYRVCLCINTKRSYEAVHRIVLSSFLGACPDGKQVNHIDGDKSNNRLENLEYVTRSENIRHSFDNGTRSQQGEKNTQSKLTEKHIHEIRQLLGKETQETIAAKFNVTRQTISKVATGATWGWLKQEGS